MLLHTERFVKMMNQNIITKNKKQYMTIDALNVDTPGNIFNTVRHNFTRNQCFVDYINY